jgi:rhamnosyltransferase subunit B
MHVLISCIGSAGDVHPFLAIAKALQQRGHAVELLTSPFFRERIEAAGIPFVPIGTVEDYERGVADPRIWDGMRGFAAMWEAMRPALGDAYDQVMARVTADTVLVGSSLAWSSRCAQEKTGLRAATVHLAPSLMFSAIDPPVWPGVGALRYLPRWCVKAVQRTGERLVLDATVAPGLNALRAEFGLPPVRRIVSTWQNSPDLVINAFPSWFAEPQADWPRQSVTTGFPRWNASSGTASGPALDDFLGAGPAPIGITPGSAMAHGRGMLARAFSACEALGRRAVIVTPYRDQLPAMLPDFAFHASYVPFDLLLPKLAAFVHHGGIGTTAQCLHAGTPQLVTPFAHDQFDNAARLRRLGVASALRPTAKVAKWVRALDRLTNDERVAAACGRVAQASRHGEPGEVLIAKRIETLAPG